MPPRKGKNTKRAREPTAEKTGDTVSDEGDRPKKVEVTKEMLDRDWQDKMDNFGRPTVPRWLQDRFLAGDLSTTPFGVETAFIEIPIPMQIACLDRALTKIECSPHITVLRLGIRCSYDEKIPFERIVSSLRTIRGLKDLDFSDSTFSTEHLALLAEYVASTPTLEQLSIRNAFQIYDRGFAEFASMLANNKTLLCLDLNCIHLRNKTAAELGDAIAKNSTLTEIDIGSNYFSSEGAESLSKGFAANHTLRVVKMENISYVDEPSMCKMYASLCENKALRSIHVAHDNDGFEHLLGLIASGALSITALYARSLVLKKSHADVMRVCLSATTQLETLELSCISSRQFAISVRDGIAENRSVKTLALASMDFEPGDIAVIIGQNTSVNSLSIRSQCVGVNFRDMEETVQFDRILRIAGAVRENTSIRTLDLTGAKMSIYQFGHLLVALEKNRAIDCLAVMLAGYQKKPSEIKRQLSRDVQRMKKQRGLPMTVHVKLACDYTEQTTYEF